VGLGQLLPVLVHVILLLGLALFGASFARICRLLAGGEVRANSSLGLARVSRHRPIGVSRGDSADSRGRTRSGPATAAGPAPAGHGEAEAPAVVGQADACTAHPATIMLLGCSSLAWRGGSVRAGRWPVRPAWRGRHWLGPPGPVRTVPALGPVPGAPLVNRERSIREVPGGQGSRWRVRRPRFRAAH